LLASLQTAMDEAVCEDVADIVARHETRRVVVAGGCAYNILTNVALEKALPNTEVFVPPNAGDCGLAMGAAVIGSAQDAGGLHAPQVALRDKRNPYKGLPLSGWTRPPTYNRENLDAVAAKLAAGGIVGLVKGRSEIGPRALGARSLLADATHPEMREILNRRVKKREWWRPFAPVARALDAHVYFDFDFEDHYMLRSATVREEWRSRLAPVTHADNSARLQVLPDEPFNPELWYILTKLQETTGIGVCLNTSLNLGGRPIVNSLEEIHDLMRSQDIDFFYVEGEIVARGEPTAPA
jgi:carbamoyltransferase